MKRELFRMEEISLRGLCLDLLRNLWMILLSAAAVWLAVTGIHNLTYTPAYTASATLVVSVQGESSAYSSLSVAASMADVFGQVFQSEALRTRIVEDVGEEIEGTITCEPISETNLLVLSTTCPDPRQAYLFINSVLQHYEEVAADVFANASLQIVQEPEVPSSPSNTSWLMAHRTLLIAMGAAGMAALICLFYVLRFTVKNVAGASRQLDGKIRGVIPHERKEGQPELFSDRRRSLRKRKKRTRKDPGKQSLLLTSSLVSMDFAEAGRRTESRIESHMRRNNQKILLVTSVTENEGKSTVAANLALAMAEKHRKVLVLDGDLRKPAQHKVFEKKEEKENSFEQVLTRKKNWRDALYYNEKDHIWQIFQYHSVSSPGNLIDQFVEGHMADEMRREFDYIIIDCPPAAISTDAENWLAAVDTAVIVVREDWADVRVINDTVDMIWQSGKDFAGFVLNAFHNDWLQHAEEYGYRGYRYRDSVRQNV